MKQHRDRGSQAALEQSEFADGLEAQAQRGLFSCWFVSDSESYGAPFSADLPNGRPKEINL